MSNSAALQGILLIGGCAGAGKTTVARALEEQEGVRHVSVDDRIEALEPRLAQLAIGADWTVPPTDVCARLVSKGRVLEPHLDRWVRQLLDRLAQLASRRPAPERRRCPRPSQRLC